MFAINDAIAAERCVKFSRPSPSVRPPATGVFPLRREDVRRIVAELLG